MDDLKLVGHALAEGVANLIAAATSKQMIGLAVTLAMQYAAAKSGNADLAPYIFGSGGAHAVFRGLADTWGKGKVEAEARKAREILAANGNSGAP